MSELDDLADDLSKVFSGPRWKFWQRSRTKTEALTAIQQALMGECLPIQRFGVAIPPSAQSMGSRWRAIKSQTRRLRGPF